MINAAVSHWMALRGRSWRLLAGELVTMLIVNLVIVLALEALDRWLGVSSARTPFGMTLFFSYLLTLVIVLYDRYRTVYKARRLYRARGEGGAAAAAAGQARRSAGRGAGLQSRRPLTEVGRVDQLLDYILHFDELPDAGGRGARPVGLPARSSLTIFAETGLVVAPFLPGESLLLTSGTLAGAGRAATSPCSGRCSSARPSSATSSTT